MILKTVILLNDDVATQFDEVAALLEHQHANPFRVQAYRDAAATLRRLSVPVDEILGREGLEGLEALPAIGTNLARGIRDIILTGRLPLLDRLRGSSDPISLLSSVPGVGPRLAERLHHDLGIGTLEELEVAAHDGRLARIGGIGPKRLGGIRDSLAVRLGRLRRLIEPPGADDPPVAELLSVDREYRERAHDGTLTKIAPRRFNPRRAKWLPVLHTHRGSRDYTALFSNTARAHQLGMTHDWVVIYCDGTGRERQYTVTTAQHGPLTGRRIVRGRELECERYHLRRRSGMMTPAV